MWFCIQIAIKKITVVVKFEKCESVHLCLGLNAESHQIGCVDAKSVLGSQNVWTV